MTGGTSGIGRGIVHRFVREGAAVEGDVGERLMSRASPDS